MSIEKEKILIDRLIIETLAGGQLRQIERLALFSAVIAKSPRHALELGTGWDGGQGSTSYIVGALMVCGGRLTSIDIDEGRVKSAKLAHPDHEFVCSDDLAWLKEHPTRMFDFVFVDNGTRSTSETIEVVSAIRIEPGAIVCAHDWAHWRCEPFFRMRQFSLISVVGDMGVMVKS